jgi:hypothetical protein
VYIVDVLDRFPLGVNYVAQAQAAYELICGQLERMIRERGGSPNGASGINFEGRAPLPPLRLYIDETGVGDAFCDMLARLLRSAESTKYILMVRVRLVGGEHYRRDYSDGLVRAITGKGFAARRLVTVIKARLVKLPAKLAGRLDTEDELRAYEARMREDDGHTTYGAQAPGTHDDLLTSVALAVLETGNEHGVTTQTYTY